MRAQNLFIRLTMYIFFNFNILRIIPFLSFYSRIVTYISLNASKHYRLLDSQAGKTKWQEETIALILMLALFIERIQCDDYFVLFEWQRGLND